MELWASIIKLEQTIWENWQQSLSIHPCYGHFFVFYRNPGHGDSRTVIQSSGLSGRGQILLMCYVMGTYTDLVITIVLQLTSFLMSLYMQYFLFKYRNSKWLQGDLKIWPKPLDIEIMAERRKTNKRLPRKQTEEIVAAHKQMVRETWREEAEKGKEHRRNKAWYKQTGGWGIWTQTEAENWGGDHPRVMWTEFKIQFWMHLHKKHKYIPHNFRKHLGQFAHNCFNSVRRSMMPLD